MTPLRIGVVSQVRNEADVLPAFLLHLAAFADDAILMDHGSVDATAALLTAACANRPGWAAWRIAVPGHHQAAFTGFAARRLLRAGVDRVLFLDADEFVDLPDRAALVDALARMDRPGDVGVWRWRDCVPDRLGSPPTFGDLVWQAPGPSRYPKVVLSQALFRASGGQAGPAPGAHFLRDAGVPTRDVPLGTLLHLPLRSVEQMRRKVVLGALAERARSDRGPTDASHWTEALARIAAASLDDDDVRGLAACYGEPGAAQERLGVDGLAARGFTRRVLAPMHAGVPAAPPASVSVLPPDASQSPDASRPHDARQPPDAWQIMAGAVLHWVPAASAGLALELVDGVLRAAEAPPAWPGPALAGTPLLDLARAVLPPGARVLAIGGADAPPGTSVTADPAAGPFDAALVADLTPATLAAAHAALPPGGLLVGEGDAAAADPALLAAVADCLVPGYGAGNGGAAGAAWQALGGQGAGWQAALARLFTIERQVDLPGAVLRPVLLGLGGRFDLSDPQDATAGRLVAALDRLLTRHGAVPPGRVAVAARRPA